MVGEESDEFKELDRVDHKDEVKIGELGSSLRKLY